MPEASEAFSGLLSLLLSLSDVDSMLQQMADLAGNSISSQLSCGITLRRDGSLFTVASSDPRATNLDESQYQTHEGPCLHAVATGHVVWVPALDEEKRWPDYMARARQTGLGCSLSLPLTMESSAPLEPGGVKPAIGALNVYGFDGPNSITTDQRRQCELFAAQAAGALQLAVSTIQAAEQRTELEAAINSRSVIDQALGILMAEQRCTAEEAFSLLRLRSQNSNTKLRDVATDLVQRVTGHPPQPGRSFNTDRP